MDKTGSPPSVAAPHNNMFFARPTFPASASNVQKKAIRARFRLANWGTHVGDLTPELERCPRRQRRCSSTWRKASVASSGRWRLPIRCWPVSGNAIMAHQCMLVELSSVFPGGETFTRSSVYRNMDFVDASRFTREAEVSARGLAPLNPQPRGLPLCGDAEYAVCHSAREDNDRSKLPSTAGAEQPEHPDAPYLAKTVAALRTLNDNSRLNTLDPDYLRLFLPTYRRTRLSRHRPDDDAAGWRQPQDLRSSPPSAILSATKVSSSAGVTIWKAPNRSAPTSTVWACPTMAQLVLGRRSAPMRAAAAGAGCRSRSMHCAACWGSSRC